MKNPMVMTPKQLAEACRKEANVARRDALRVIAPAQLAALESQRLVVVPAWFVDTLYKTLETAPEDA